MLDPTVQAPVGTVDVDHGRDLEKGDDQQRQGTYIVIKDGQPVVSRFHSEYECHNKGNQAHQPYREKTIQLVKLT